MKSRPYDKLVSLLMVLLLGACNLPFGSGSGTGKRDPDRVKMTVTETVAALGDPVRAEEGVWSLLAHLGIGVYTGDGIQVMPGSETGEADFWLYDFEVGSLASMATQEAEPFSTYHVLLAGLGYPGSKADLLTLYRETYAEYRDHAFVQLLDEMDISFSSNQSLTPLQSWLLLLDSFIPPNGDPAISSNRRLGGGRLAIQAPLRQGLPCGLITGGGIIPYWGILRSEADLAAYLTAVEVYYAIHGPMLASAVKASLSATTSEVHEGHNESGDRVEYMVDVRIAYIPLVENPVAAISCGALTLLSWQPLVGGFSDVPVEWQDPFVLTRHGELEEMENVTDYDGKAQLIFQMEEEEAAGIGPYREEEGLISATLDLKFAFLKAGINDERLLSFIQTTKKLEPEEVLVSWHDSCDEFSFWFSEVLVQDFMVYSNEIFIEGRIMVDIDLESDPASLEGSGTLPIMGQGQAGDCEFSNSGTDYVTVSGTVLPGEGDDPPMLKMNVNHSFQIKMEGNHCGGGSPMPIPAGEYTLEMPLRDDETQSDNFDQPSIVGLTEYTLEVFCGD